MRNKRKKVVEFYRNYMRSYWIFMVLVLTIIGLSYMILNNRVYNEHIKIRETSLAGSVEVFTEEMSRYQHMASSLFTDKDAVYFMRDEVRVQDYIKAVEFHDKYIMPAIYEDRLLDFIVYFPKSDTLFSSEAIFWNSEEYYTYFFPLRDTMSYEEFIGLITCTDDMFPGKAIEHGGRNYLPVSFIHNEPNLSVYTFYDITDFIDSRNSVYSKENTAKFRILSPEKGELYSNFPEGTDISGMTEIKAGREYSVVRDNMYITSKARYLGLEFQSLISKDDVAPIMQDLINGYAMTFGILALLSTGLTLLLSFWVNKPVYKLSVAYDKQLSLVELYHFNRLIDGMSGEDALTESARNLGIEIDKPFVICNVDTEEMDEEEKKALFTELSSSGGETYRLLAKKTKNHITCLIFNMDGDTERFKEAFRKYAESQPKAYFAFGDFFTDDLQSITISMGQADNSLRYLKQAKTDNFILYEDRPDVEEVTIFDISLRNKLEILIGKGEVDKAVEALKESFTEDKILAFTLNPLAANCLISQIASILIRLIKLKVNNADEAAELFVRTAELFNTENYESFIGGFREICLKIAEKIPGAEERKQHLSDEILAYVADNYANINMSLTLLGDVFHMNESYISQYIKVHANQNFSSYLESIRMEKAKELMETTNLNVSEVFEKVGYTNRSTFYKAFMRSYGISPKAFKENVMMDRRLSEKDPE